MPKDRKKVSAISLAAGLGTRMKSEKAKVLHELNGRPMILYVVETAKKIVGDQVVVVIGYQAENVRKVVSEHAQVSYSVQDRQLGTGHAVWCALPFLPDDTEEVMILCGDVPILTSDTAVCLLDDHVISKRDLSILAVNIENPKGYGRILLDESGKVRKIVEESDASKQQKKIKTINTGIYCAKKDFLKDSLSKIKPVNVQKEFYLTDIIEIGYNQGKRVGVMIGNDHEEVLGINSYQDLREAETVMRSRQGKIS